MKVKTANMWSPVSVSWSKSALTFVTLFIISAVIFFAMNQLIGQFTVFGITLWIFWIVFALGTAIAIHYSGPIALGVEFLLWGGFTLGYLSLRGAGFAGIVLFLMAAPLIVITALSLLLRPLHRLPSPVGKIFALAVGYIISAILVNLGFFWGR